VRRHLTEYGQSPNPTGPYTAPDCRDRRAVFRWRPRWVARLRAGHGRSAPGRPRYGLADIRNTDLWQAISFVTEFPISGREVGISETCRRRPERSPSTLNPPASPARAGDVLAARDDSRFDAFASVAGDAFDVERRKRHTA
jgi:hypothetical protein